MRGELFREGIIIKRSVKKEEDRENEQVNTEGRSERESRENG